jgi:hypothetical protein
MVGRVFSARSPQRPPRRSTAASAQRTRAHELSPNDRRDHARGTAGTLPAMARRLLIARDMLYRKSSPTPPRLLLRIVAAAGAGALVGACSSGSSSEPQTPVGVTINYPEAGDEMPVVAGSVPLPLDAGHDADAELPCGIGVCGSIGQPAADGSSDAEVAEVGFPGLVVHPESGTGDL